MSRAQSQRGVEAAAPISDHISPLSPARPPTTFRAMNVFVTGGAGYIGSICTEELLNAGHNVTVYDNLSEGHRSAVDSRAKFVLGKPEEPGDTLKAVKESKAEAIIHFAGSILVGESMAQPGKYFHNNVTNSLKLLDAAIECGVKK